MTELYLEYSGNNTYPTVIQWEEGYRIEALFILLVLTGLLSWAKRIQKQNEKLRESQILNKTFASPHDIHVETFDFSVSTGHLRNFWTKPITCCTHKQPDAWLTPYTQNWMANLHDSTRLSNLSIPGTHDTASVHGGLWEVFVKTQSWSIQTQLDAGIRYFDIRCRREGDKFAIYHGHVSQQIDFDDVLNIIKSFLQSNPSETLLMRIKEEYKPTENSLQFGVIWDTYMKEKGYGEMMACNLNSCIPCLGSVRGKIVILRDEEDIDRSYGLEYNRTGNAVMEVQDDYSIHAFYQGMSKKKAVIKEYICKAREGCEKLVINHCSGTWIPIYSPIGVARKTNRAAYDEIACLEYPNNKCVGIIVMDFPGEELIHKIISANIASC